MLWRDSSCWLIESLKVRTPSIGFSGFPVKVGPWQIHSGYKPVEETDVTATSPAFWMDRNQDNRWDFRGLPLKYKCVDDHLRHVSMLMSSLGKVGC